MADQFSLRGKVVAVTGASRGIGEGIALEVAAAGGDLALFARTADRLEAVAARARGAGVRAEVYPVDQTSIADATAALERAAKSLGGLDVLVANAGGGSGGFTWAMNLTEEQWDTVMDLNFKSTFFVAQAAARIMRERGGGKIVVIGSVASDFPAPQLAHYGAAKAGLLMLCRTLAIEWAQFGIRVNSVLPGRIPNSESQTRYSGPEETPMGRFGTPADVAAAVIYLASSAGDWVSGTSITIDGGQSLPSSIRHMLAGQALKRAGVAGPELRKYLS